MKRNIILITAMAISALLFTSCGNNSGKKAENSASVQRAAAEMTVDELLTKAESLADKQVEFQGVCTHTCQHGATKMFLMGSDDTKTIRVEACKLGSFDTKCVNSMVKVTGVLKEQRIDEAYLQNWEAALKAANTQTHGNSEAGCDSEKLARGETADTPEGRIADFRTKIAQRKAATGKDYLSFYYVDAISYEIR